jgi:hypothetical protein
MLASPDIILVIQVQDDQNEHLQRVSSPPYNCGGKVWKQCSTNAPLTLCHKKINVNTRQITS